jgi:hypothetical protein
MPNNPVSAFPPGTALDGTEKIGLVQAGISRRVTVDAIATRAAKLGVVVKAANQDKTDTGAGTPTDDLHLVENVAAGTYNVEIALEHAESARGGLIVDLSTPPSTTGDLRVVGSSNRPVPIDPTSGISLPIRLAGIDREGGVYAYQSATQALDPLVVAAVDGITLFMQWEQFDPTDASGNKLPYAWNGNNGGFGSSAATGAGANLKLFDSLRTTGQGGKRASLGLRAGQSCPKYLVGAVIGDPDFPIGSFPTGLVGTMGAFPHVVTQRFSQQAGSNTVRSRMFPVPGGGGDAIFEAAMLAFLTAMKTALKGQYVDNVHNTGPTLWDVVENVVVMGMQRGTEEMRVPNTLPALVNSGTNKALGSPDCTIPGVAMSLRQWSEAGATLQSFIDAHGRYVDIHNSVCGDKRLQMPSIIAAENSNDLGLPNLSGFGRWPTAVIDIVATQTANAGSRKANVTTLVLANHFLTSAGPNGNNTFLDIPDPADTGNPHESIWVSTDKGMDRIQYTSVDLATLQLRGCTLVNGNNGDDLLGVNGSANSIVAVAQITMGAITNVVQFAPAFGTTADYWKDGTPVMVYGAPNGTGGAGTGLSSLNGKPYTARGVGTSPPNTNPWYSDGTTRTDPNVNGHFTLTDAAGNLVTLADISGSLATMFIQPLCVGPLTDGSGIPLDPIARNNVISAGTKLGNRLMVLDTGLMAPPVGAPISGILATDSPSLAWTLGLGLGIRIGGQSAQGTYGPTSGAANTTTSASSPSGGTATTATIPLTGASPAGVTTACVNGTDVTVTAGAGTTSLTVTPAVAFPNLARVSFSPPISGLIAAMLAEQGGPITYVEMWTTLNVDADTATAVAASYAADIPWQRTVLTGRIVTPGGLITVQWAKAAADANAYPARVAAGSTLKLTPVL